MPVDSAFSESIESEDVPAFRIGEHLHTDSGFRLLDWNEVATRVAKIGSLEQRQLAWTACKRAWLECMRKTLGEGFEVRESDTTLLLSSYSADLACSALNYFDRNRTPT